MKIKVYLSEIHFIPPLSCDLLHYKCFEYIAFFDIIEFFQSYTAFIARCNFLDIVLETAERGNLVLKYNYAVAHYSYLSGAGNLAVLNIRACDGSDAGNMDSLAYLGMTEDNLAVYRLEHTLDSGFYLLYAFIDDSVCADIDTLLGGIVHSKLIGTDIEADDDGIRSGGECDIALCNAADTGMDNIDMNFIV